MKALATLLVFIYTSGTSAFVFTPSISGPSISGPSINSDASLKRNTMLKMGLFDFPKKVEEKQEANSSNVVIDPSYELPLLFAATGIFVLLTDLDSNCVETSVICAPSIGTLIQGALNIIFALFLTFQAGRVRFVFDDTSFELKTTGGNASESNDGLGSSGENFVVGGANRWDYDTFVNWRFFPNEDVPILIYFKETQTPEENWSEGPGKLDKKGGGQVHFFPAIANVKQLKEQFEIRGCAKIENDA